MTANETDADSHHGEWNSLVTQLRELRKSADNPSYAEIAERIKAQRQEAGQSSYEARIARSTVYDAFTFGRPRINIPLTREIVTALGGRSEQVDEWLDQCRSPQVLPPALRQIVLLLLACLAINFLGRWLVTVLHLPIYMDMIGTALAALALGPWRGALVGGLTNLGGSLISSMNSIPFALVNVVGALAWGYGVRRFNMGSSLPRFLALNLIVAFVCSLVAVPILLILYGGSVGHAEDLLGERFVHLLGWNVAAIFIANLMTSVADKLLSGFIALVALAALPANLSVGWTFHWTSSASTPGNGSRANGPLTE